MEKLTVSIAMAVYNGEMYLSEQIKSIQCQLLDDDELIISYNHSNDNTLNIIKNFAQNDRRIKIYINEISGIVANFENAIKHCHGDIIFYSDQDDVWLEKKIEKVRNEFLNKNVSVVIHDAILTDDKLNILDNSTFRIRNTKTSLFRNLIRLGYIGCSMAFLSKYKNIVLPIPTRKRSHDWWTGSICSMYGKMVMLKEPLILHRMHSLNSTPKKRENLFGLLQIRFLILKNLVIRKYIQKLKPD